MGGVGRGSGLSVSLLKPLLCFCDLLVLDRAGQPVTHDLDDLRLQLEGLGGAVAVTKSDLRENPKVS